MYYLLEVEDSNTLVCEICRESTTYALSYEENEEANKEAKKNYFK